MVHYLITGRAGTGKTSKALSLGRGQDIIIIKPLVQTRNIGHLPGDLRSKLDPHINMYVSLMETLKYKPSNIRNTKYYCTSILRGVTFDNCFVLLDEAQNCTLHEFETVLTRIGEAATLCVVMDTNQIDDPKADGKLIQERYSKCPSVIHEHLTTNYRSSLLEEWWETN